MAKKKTTATKAKKKAPAKAAKRKTPAKKVAPKKAAAVKAKKVKKSAAKSAPKKTTARTISNSINLNQPLENMMTKGKTQYDQLAQDAANISREGIEAASKSASIFAKGYEDIFRASISLAQETAEKQAEFFKKAMSTKSLNELAEFQNAEIQKSYDTFVAGVTRISEMSVKTLTEASAPINDQINKAVQKASQAMAA